MGCKAARLGADGALGGGPSTASPLLLPQQAGGSWLEPAASPMGRCQKGPGRCPPARPDQDGGRKGGKVPMGRPPAPSLPPPPAAPYPAGALQGAGSRGAVPGASSYPPGRLLWGRGGHRGYIPVPGPVPVLSTQSLWVGGSGGLWGGAVRSLRWAESAARLQRQRMQGAGGIGAAGGMRAPTAPRGPAAGRGVTG